MQREALSRPYLLHTRGKKRRGGRNPERCTTEDGVSEGAREARATGVGGGELNGTTARLASRIFSDAARAV